MTKIGYVTFYIFFVLIVTFLCSLLGVTVDGGVSPGDHEFSLNWETLIDVFSGILTFGYDGIEWLSILFYGLTIIFLWALLEIIRGV